MTNAEAIKILLNEWKCIDRNDGINCNRKCESCDLVMDSAVLKDAYNLAIKALEAQEWIPVDKKSHPDTPVRVQVQLDNGWIITAYYQEDEWLSVPDFGEPIQDRWIEAWKPMTEPYKEDT